MSEEEPAHPDGGHRALIPLAGGDIPLSRIGAVDREAIADLEERIKWAENDSEAAKAVAKQAIERANEMGDELDERRTRDQNLVQQIADLERQVADLEEQTKLLQAINRASSLKKEQRVAVLVQTLYNKARRHGREQGGKPRATGDINTYEDALGGDVEATYFYRDAKAAVELVGDEDVLKFKKEAPGARKNSRLILNLEEGNLPALIAGRNIGEEANQWTA